MFKKKVVAAIVASVVTAAVVWFVGCSNDSFQPVSVSQNDNPTSASTGFTAMDIAAAGTGADQVWAVSKESAGGGDYYIYKWNGSSWTKISNGWGIRIAVNTSGKPFVVNTAGEIWSYNGSSWSKFSPAKAAKDIALANDENPWIIAKGTGNQYVYKYDGTAWKVKNMTGVKISVDPITVGKAIVVKNNGYIYKYCTQESKWQVVLKNDNSTNMLAYDVGCGRSDKMGPYVYIISRETLAGYPNDGYMIYRGCRGDANHNSSKCYDWEWLCGLGNKDAGICGTGSTSLDCFAINNPGTVIKYNGYDPTQHPPVPGHHYWDEY